MLFTSPYSFVSIIDTIIWFKKILNPSAGLTVLNHIIFSIFVFNLASNYT